MTAAYGLWLFRMQHSRDPARDTDKSAPGPLGALIDPGPSRPMAESRRPARDERYELSFWLNLPSLWSWAIRNDGRVAPARGAAPRAWRRDRPAALTPAPPYLFLLIRGASCGRAARLCF